MPSASCSLESAAIRVLLLEGLGLLAKLPEPEVAETADAIARCQERASGLFLYSSNTERTDENCDAEYLEWRHTYFALHALDAVKATPLCPPLFARKYYAREELTHWLENRSWQRPAREADRIMFLLSFFVHLAEVGGEDAARKSFHHVLDWLERVQHRVSGLWGTGEGAAVIGAAAAAGRILPFFEYVERPIPAINAIVDSVLSILRPEGTLVSTETEGGPYEELCLFDTLAITLRHTGYRRGDVMDALSRGLVALLRIQNDDGGFFCAADGKSAEPGISVVPNEIAPAGKSDVWTTWVRLVALHTVSDTLTGPRADEDWTYRRTPAIGFHRFGTMLSERDLKVLPGWFRYPPVLQGHGILPDVSVVIPAYNLGRYLPQTLLSVFAQTAFPENVVIVDDGSTDALTPLFLEHLAHPAITVIRQENRGLPAARNAGIESVSSEFIVCLDADDTIEPEYLRLLREKIASSGGIGFVTSHYQCFDNDDTRVAPAVCRLPDMLIENTACVASMFRRAAWAKAGKYAEDMTGLQDWNLWLGILENGYVAEVVPEPLFNYRVRPGSMYSQSKKPEKYSALYRTIIEKHRSLYEAHLTDVLVGYARKQQEVGLAWEEGRHWLRNVEKARDFYAAQNARSERAVDELRNWVKQIEDSKEFILTDRGKLREQLEEVREWLSKVTTAKEWLAQELERASDEASRLLEQRDIEISGLQRKLDEASHTIAELQALVASPGRYVRHLASGLVKKAPEQS